MAHDGKRTVHAGSWLGTIGWRRRALLPLGALLALAGSAAAQPSPGSPETTAPPPAAAANVQQTLPLEFYKPITFLVYTHDFNSDWSAKDRQPEELKLQFSFKKALTPRFWGGSTVFYFGYSQKSFWQVFDDRRSLPFRESNYNPEGFFETRLPAGFFGLQGYVRWGGEHESNGRGNEVQVNGSTTVGSPAGSPPPAGAVVVDQSRSWNRLYVQPVLRFPDLWNSQIAYKVWYAFPADENRNVRNYLGDGELTVQVASDPDSGGYPNHRASVMLRQGLLGATTVQFDYQAQVNLFWTWVADGSYFHLQYFNGYGESLIDYNRIVKRIGVGLSFGPPTRQGGP
jgi:phospholipase A1